MQNTIINGIDISNLLKAINMFEQFRININTDRDKAGAIQAFEFSFELAWKTMKRILSQKGVEVRSPRDCFREAALNKLISDPEQWFLFLAKRNQTTHTYDLETVSSILSHFDAYSRALTELQDNLNKLIV